MAFRSAGSLPFAEYFLGNFGFIILIFQLTQAVSKFFKKKSMKKNSLVFIIKFLINTFCIVYSFSVDAQTITGKWKLTDAKETVTDKASGKTHDLGAQIKPFLKTMEQVIIFNTDNTYSFSNRMGDSKDALEGSGTYSISGNQLKLNQAKTNMPAIDKKYLNGSTNTLPPTATIVSQTTTALVLHYSSETNDNGKSFVVNIEDTFTKQ